MTRRLGVLPLLYLTSLFSLVHSRHSTRLVYEYPEIDTWIENAAVRSDGCLLLTSIGKPGGLSLLNPFDGRPPMIISNDFDGRNSTLGIVETYPDIFYLISSNFSLSPSDIGTVPGSNAIYKVDFTRSPSSPIVSLLGRYPKTGLLNGLTKFNDTLLLAADSTLAAVWAIDTRTAAIDLVVQSERLKGTGADGFFEGINGLHFHAGTLYLTNSQKMTFASVPLDSHARPAGPVSILTESLPQKGVRPNWDDFAIDAAGRYAYVATEICNSVQRVDLQSGRVDVVAGGINSTAIAEPTSVVFGRTERDSDVVYVMTAGGTAFPVYVAGKETKVGAQIVAVDLSSSSSSW